MKKIGFILLGIICILFSSRWTLTAQAGTGTLLSLEDGEYAIEVTMTGGSGKASIQSPALLTVTDGTAYISITWSSSNYDYMVVDNRKYENESAKDANSHFTIPVLDLTKELTVRADTLAMGTPHEIEYTLQFNTTSIASKSTLPQEGAKRVLMMAAVIIIGGGILNHIVNERRKRDYTGKRRTHVFVRSAQ